MSVPPQEQHEEEDAAPKSFTVSDRRSSRMQDTEKAAADAAKDEQRRQAERRFEQARGQQPLPGINFSTFLLSLGSTALVQLGEVEDPGSGVRSANLDNAKQTIDILGMLQEKTKGNLIDEESQLLENLLYDLRMRYVGKQQAVASGQPERSPGPSARGQS